MNISFFATPLTLPAANEATATPWY